MNQLYILKTPKSILYLRHRKHVDYEQFRYLLLRFSIIYIDMYNMCTYNMHISCRLYAYIMKRHCALRLILKRKCSSVSCLEDIVPAFPRFPLQVSNAMQLVKCFDLGMISFSYRMALTWGKKIPQFCSCGQPQTDVEGSIYEQATCSAAQRLRNIPGSSGS